MSEHPKKMKYEKDALDKLFVGIDQLANLLSPTIGPKGKNVGLEHLGEIILTKDSLTILDKVELNDPFANMGAAFGKKLASDMGHICKDGRKTAVLLLKELIYEGKKNILAGASAILIKKGMEKALAKLLSQIEKMQRKVKDRSEIVQIAKASAANSDEVGEKIDQAFDLVGTDGMIFIESGKKQATTLEQVKGLCLDSGYKSGYFCTDLKNRTVELNNPLILVTDQTIDAISEILPLLQTLSSLSKEFLIIADDIEPDALSTLVMNKMQGLLKVAAISAPSFGDKRAAILEDIAVLTGANLLSDERGFSLKESTTEDLGRCEKITISKDQCFILGGKGEKSVISERVLHLCKQIKKTKEPSLLEKLKKRRASLLESSAILRVGADSDVEMQYKKKLYESALHVTEAALKEGVVIGGGICLLQASLSLDLKEFSHEELVGAKIVKKACIAPIKHLIANVGYDPTLILEKIAKSKNSSMGFNVLTEKVQDLKKVGILDPVVVVKTVIEQAISTAGVILLTDVLIANEQ